MRVLIAEDDRVSRHVLERTLEQWGHKVVAAQDGDEAWRIFQSEEFTMVVSDWMMPIVDGLELVRRIRSQNRPGYVYVVLLTAKSQKQDIVVGMEAGADDVITKPFDQSELRARLHAGERILELEQDLASRNEALEEANQLVTVINEKMRQNLEAAARIQESLLPKILPAMPGAQFAWNFIPCDELAGDILNIFRLDEDHVAFYVLDVSNHGVPAALLAVTLSRLLSPLMTQSLLLKQPADDGGGYRLSTPAEVAVLLNQQFPMDSQIGQYFTLLFGIVSPKNREVRYVQAGHPSPILVNALTGEVKALEGDGLPIGFMENTSYQEHRLLLQPGDRIYIYSDGIIEASNDEGELFGEERLVRNLAEARSLPLKQSLAHLTNAIVDWCGIAGAKDDVSLVALEME